MTATELFDALQGLPKEATCGTITYSSDRDGSLWWSIRTEHYITDDHAEALQRDAMTEYLMRREPFIMPLYQDGQWWLGNGGYPSRTLALIAAVRYVAGEGK